MDGLRKQVDGSTSAMVVRQFSPSRIEKQLLAQTFELVIGLQTEADDRPSKNDPAGRDDKECLPYHSPSFRLVGRDAA